MAPLMNIKAKYEWTAALSQRGRAARFFGAASHQRASAVQMAVKA